METKANTTLIGLFTLGIMAGFALSCGGFCASATARTARTSASSFPARSVAFARARRSISTASARVRCGASTSTRTIRARSSPSSRSSRARPSPPRPAPASTWRCSPASPRSISPTSRKRAQPLQRDGRRTAPDRAGRARRLRRHVRRAGDHAHAQRPRRAPDRLVAEGQAPCSAASTMSSASPPHSATTQTASAIS